MRIEELHLKNFRCFKELDIQFPKSNLAVFIGLNGAGKSAILDAIIISIADALKSPRVITPQNKIEKKIKYTSISSPDILKGESYYEFSIVLTYQPSFTLVQYTAARQIIKPINNVSFKSLKGFDNFKKWFIEEDAKEGRLIRERRDFNITNPKLDIIRRAVEVFCTKIENLKVSNLRTKDISDTNLVVDLDNRLTLSLEQLSEGQRNLLLLVSDIAFSLLNYREVDISDGFSDKPDTVLNRNGIVLIDEIELHLHPQWQREVLPALQKTFPNIQFIVTTHSPQVLSRVHRDDIFILKDNKLYQPSSNPIGRDTNGILEEVMQVCKRPKEIQDLSDKYFSLLNKNQFDDAKTVRQELEKELDKDDPIFVGADTLITRKMLLKK